MYPEKKLQSIFVRIRSYIEETGSLPADFRCEEDDPDDGELKFAPGALEGILGHHVSGEKGDEKGISAFIREHLAVDPGTAVRLYEKQWGSQKTATLREGVLKAILAQEEEFDADRLAVLAYTMMTEGRRTETVKMGLTLMSLLDTSDDEVIKDALFTLGCCEDFTNYVFENIADWPEDEQNRIYFALAKKLQGWGKIEAVEHLTADTDEIKEWLLCEGCRNTILYAYLGFECAVKCDYKNRLRKGGLTDAELLGACDIMDGLLEEGPCPGLSALKEPEETIYWYLNANSGKTIDVTYLRQLLSMRDFLNCCHDKTDTADDRAPSCGNRPVTNDSTSRNGSREPMTYDSRDVWRRKATAKLASLLDAANTREMILRELEQKPYDAIHTAIALQIDISEELFALMQNRFDSFYQFGYYFLEPEESTPRAREIASRYIDLCEAHLDYDKLPARANRFHGSGTDRHWNIDMAVQYLDRHPGLGNELIRVSLCSPSVRWRNMAVKALLGWKNSSGKSLREFAPALSEDARRAAEQESDPHLKDRFSRLLG